MGNINITDKAISKIQEVLASQGMKYFRIRVKGGGCSGFQYIFKSDNQLNSEKDIIFKFKNLQILVDKNSIEYIDQAELDYKDELIGSSFSISNPNAKSLPHRRIGFSQAPFYEPQKLHRLILLDEHNGKSIQALYL